VSGDSGAAIRGGVPNDRDATVSPTAGERDATRVRAWHAGVVLALMAAQIACGVLSSTASSDTSRDLFLAEQIATGTAFPLTGPEINGMLHLGPLWYYLLAIPLLVISNAAAVTGFVAFISALQFPLAYLLGRRVATAREGLLFALALALPGWMNLSLASTTHPILAPTALLAGAFAALKYRERPDVAHAALLGLACVAMLTAHPTLVLLAGALVLWSAARTPTRIAWLGHALAVGALLALSLAPMLYEQWRGGFADAASMVRYTHDEWNVPSPVSAATLLHAVLVYGPKYVTRFVLEMPARPARLALLVYDLTILAAAAGLVWRLIREPSKRALIGALLALLFAQSMFVCAIRVGMPPWMVAAQWPLIAALVALGLEAFCKGGRSGRVLVGAALLATTSLTLCVYARFVEGPLDHAEIKSSPGKSGFMNVRDYEKAMYHYRLARIPFRELFAIGDLLCEPVALYGHYAYLVDYTFAVSALARCGGTGDVQFGGMPSPGRRALVGLHESAWSALGMQPEQRIGVLGFSAPAAIWHSPVPFAPVVPRFSNRPRQLDSNVRRTTISGDAPADQAVLVAHRANRYASFEVAGARANGKDAAPAWTDVTTAVFRAPAGQTGTVHWDIDIRAVPDYVDVLTFASH
jgi:hypothetical protein